MNNFSENIVNQRFKAVFEELEARRLIKGKSDIAKRLGTYNHVVNSILKGQRNVTVDQLWKLFETYEVNANYLFGQSEDIFLPTAKILDLLPTRSLRSAIFPEGKISPWCPAGPWPAMPWSIRTRTF